MCAAVVDAPGARACAEWGRAASSTAGPASPLPSTLAAHFARLASADSVEVREGAALGGLCDSVLRALHEAAESNRPQVDALLAALPDQDRRENVMWLLQAFDVLGFSDEAFAQAILVLDRYYSREGPWSAMSASETQPMLLASACLALKVGLVEDAAAPMWRVVSSLSRGQVPCSSVMTAEFVILRKLGFVVDTPTALDHLAFLAVRQVAFDVRSQSLANYLVQLSLPEALMHYEYPLAILAAAALTLALSTLQVPAVAYDALLEDLALCFPEGEDLALLLVPACGALHTLWVQSLAWPAAPIAEYAQCLRRKFSRPAHHRVAGFPPPASPPFASPWQAPRWPRRGHKPPMFADRGPGEDPRRR